jgi:D-inositol-3-phosphate glycosyltransferase
VSNKRIAVIAYHASPLVEPGSGDAGGMTVYVRALARALSQRGMSSDIFTRASGDVPPVVEISPGVRVVSIPAGSREPLEKEVQQLFIDDFIVGVAAFATAQRVRYDLVHSHYWQSGIAATHLAQRWAVPMVHSNHTLGRVKNRSLAPGDTPETAVRITGETEVIDSSDVLVASTTEESEYLVGLYGAAPERVKVLLPGVDHALFMPGDKASARAGLGLSDDQAVLLFVGRIQRLKGIELAIRAVEQLLPALDRKLELLIVGGPSGSEGYAELDRLKGVAAAVGVSEVVRFVGPQPHDRLVEFYRAADAALVCSYSESFGLTALEAHASGTPVVATAIDGLSHIVVDGDTGYLVPSRDPAEFAAPLKTLLGDADLHSRVARRAHEKSLAFSWDAAADGFLDLYECLLREESPELCTC